MTDPKDKHDKHGRPTPPGGSRRHQTQTERDTEGYAARKERESKERESAGVPAPFDREEITGKYTGEDLAERRAQRPTLERISILERKSDEHAKAMAEVIGELKLLPELLALLRSFATAAQEREGVHFAAQVEIGKDQAKDKIDAKRVRRRTVAKVVTGVLGGAGLMEILRLIFERLG